MVFTSHIFIFYFLPVVLLIYYLLPGRRNEFLLLVSYVFYGWWKPWFVLLMLFSTAVNYVCGQKIATAGENNGQRFRWLVISVITSLGILGFFKYFMFFQGNLNYLMTAFNASTFPVYEVILPVGISFYIFQSLSYSIDVYRKQSPPVRSFFDFACFVSLFPQLIAGPIVRYNTIADQLVHRTHTIEKFASGTALFILVFPRSCCWPIPRERPPTRFSPHRRPEPSMRGSGLSCTPFRYISIFRDIRIWRSGWAG